MGEIDDAVTRISGLVGAAKQYSQLDRAPHQTVDVHELLDATLVMLSREDPERHPGRHGVRPRRCRAIPAYAAELNQVWTNLIDNAVGAMDGGGHADHPHRAADGDRLAVEIADTGPGHPRRDPPAHLRAVLHHQAGRRGHRPRAWTSPTASWSRSTTATSGSTSAPGRHPLQGPAPPDGVRPGRVTPARPCAMITVHER